MYGTLFPKDNFSTISTKHKTGVTSMGYSYDYAYTEVKVQNGQILTAMNFSYGMPSPFSYTFQDWKDGRWVISNLSCTFEPVDSTTFRFTMTKKVTANGAIITTEYYIEIDEVGLRFRSSPIYPISASWVPMHTTKDLVYSSSPVIPEPSLLYKSVYNDLIYHRQHPSNLIFSDLVRRATDDASFTKINSIEFLKDLPEVLGELKTAKELVVNHKINMKDVAGLFLSVKYGTKLTVADTKEYLRDSERSLKRAVKKTLSARAREVIRERSGGLLITSTYNMKIYYKAHDEIVNKTMNTMLSCGIFPSPGNVWAIVPYSFVLDWAVPISSYLDAYDAKTFWATCIVTGEVMSDKLFVQNITEENCDILEGWIGSVNFKSYRRSIFNHLTHQPVYCDTKSGGFSNYASATALIIQRLD